MIYVGIDVAKDKHDCFAMNSEGEILIEKLTIANNLNGFETLYNSLMNFSDSLNNFLYCLFLLISSHFLLILKF